ncbi:MAG: hypothetical protein NVSMB9_05720 [Isosphaeraceae bacterium]
MDDRKDRGRSTVSKVLARAGLMITCLLVAGPGAWADRIALRGGGQIRGKVLPNPKKPELVFVLSERGKTPLSLRKEQILEVVPEPSALDDYLPRRDSASPTADAQYKLGLWCEQHKLLDLATIHYQAAIRHDPSFGPAHRKLGHVQQGDRWFTNDEIRLAQGLVRYKGQWITREEKERRENSSAATAEKLAWVRRIRILHETMQQGAGNRGRDAERQLRAIRDPAAVGALVKVLGDEEEPSRTLLAQLLGAIPGPEAAKALVDRLLAEEAADVRNATMDELERRTEPEISRLLVRSLRAGSSEVINRAAWALGNLNQVTAVPGLIGALVTTRQQMVLSSPTGEPMENSSGLYPYGSSPLAPSMPGPPIAFNGSTVGYLTGPAVAPGAVAFGATSAPYYPTSDMSLPSINAGGGGGTPLAGIGIAGGGGLNGSRGPIPRLVTIPIQNREVLAALVKLTGCDFGFDVSAWRQWLRTSFKTERTPARRVPQP